MTVIIQELIFLDSASKTWAIKNNNIPFFIFIVMINH